MITKEILKKMMELPHRGSGTIYEAKAAEYIKNVYKYFGFEAKEVESRTIKNSLNKHLSLSIALILLTMAVNFLNITFITLPLFAISAVVYLRVLGIPFRFIKKRSITKNLYVEINSAQEQKNTIVLTSHYDTGRNYGALVNILAPLKNILKQNQLQSTKGFNVFQYINNPMTFINFAFGVTLLSIFIPENYAKFFFAFFAGTPLIIGLLFIIKSNKKYSPGAFDNGVGTSLIIEIASILKANPLKNTKVIVANIGAEETLTPGTLTLLNNLDLEKGKTFILDIDCIGESNICLIDSEPMYPIGTTINYDSSFEVLLDFADEYLQKNYLIDSSSMPTDNQKVVLAGYRVMGLITTEAPNGQNVNYHTSKDTMDKIKWDSVEEVKNFIVEYLNYFDVISKDYII